MDRAADIFGVGSGVGNTDQVADLKVLHAKIGQQALDIDLLGGALTKAGLLSAKR